MRDWGLDFSMFYHFYPGLNPLSLTVIRFITMVDHIAIIRRLVANDPELAMEMMADKTTRELIIETQVNKAESRG